MKLNLEIDCSPEEARRFLGLPDVTRANEMYMDAVLKAMQGGGSLEQLAEYTKQFAPMGQMGLKMFQQLIEAGVGMAGKPKG
ncbi:DUF6489 family protein [Novosphingobium sp.]|jgi:hypothetical protein|uniref:DUF6489 family protein n=1 Tax=Novosphingobium sp. TaxID=1874826 RepID=UPI0031E32B52